MSERPLRIVVMTQNVNSIVRALLATSHEIVGFAEAFSQGKGSFFEILRYRAKTLKQYFRSPDKSLRRFAHAHSISYFLMQKNNTNELVAWIRKKQPDLIVVFWLPQLIPESVFSIPPLGTINLHPALLPSYRGPSPFFWSYYDNELTLGATVHYIDAGEDTGDIIVQRSIAMSPGIKLEEAASLVLDKLGVELILEAVELISRGTAPRIPQSAKIPTLRARNIKPQDYPGLIPWETWNTARIWHFLRGTEYWFQKSGHWNAPGVRYYIEKLELSPAHGSTPGKIYDDGDGKPFLACFDGRIYLTRKFTWSSFWKDLWEKLYL